MPPPTAPEPAPVRFGSEVRLVVVCASLDAVVAALGTYRHDAFVDEFWGGGGDGRREITSGDDCLRAGLDWSAGRRGAGRCYVVGFSPASASAYLSACDPACPPAWAAAWAVQTAAAEEVRARHRSCEAMVVAAASGEGRCVACRCGDPRILQFDHVDPAGKKDNVRKLLAEGRVDDAIAEAGKCRLLCAPCHRAHTSEQRASKRRRGAIASAAEGAPRLFDLDPVSSAAGLRSWMRGRECAGECGLRCVPENERSAFKVTPAETLPGAPCQARLVTWQRSTVEALLRSGAYEMRCFSCWRDREDARSDRERSDARARQVRWLLENGGLFRPDVHESVMRRLAL